jgi:myosin heavy subunit
MQNDEQSPDLADETTKMATEGAVNGGTELRKRRSTRIVQAVPLMVTGVDALGRPFAERTSTLIINCHGCRYQSKHYVLKNMWVNLEVPHSEAGHSPRRVRGKVAWIQRPRTVRQLFQVALELELPGNVWGIGFPPEDWFVFPEEGSFLPNAVAPADSSVAPLPPAPSEAPLPIAEAEPGVASPDNIRVFPAPASTTEASMQLARQVARLLAEARQQIHAAAQEAAAQAVNAERRLAFEQWEQKFSAFREEVGRETAHAVGTIQEEAETRARTTQAAAAEALKSELPRWLAPQLEQLTHELTTQLAREGAVQREQHEKQLASTRETLQTLCGQADEAAAKLRTQAEMVETQVSARLEAAAQNALEVARQREESAGTSRETLNAAISEMQQRVAAMQSEAQSSLREHLTQEVREAQARWQNELEQAMNAAQERAEENLKQHTQELRKQAEEESSKQSSAVQEAVEAQTKRLEETVAQAKEAAERLEQFPARIETVQQQAVSRFQSQLDDVLELHRNELQRRSETLFEEIHARIRSSFEAANSEALEKFDEQVQSMVAPHIQQTEEAVHRLAGGRSLLDAAMTMQQDRIRGSADEAFAESLARFRENLGSVEQILNESAQTITARHLEELENKAVDVKHESAEELYKTAEWYEKKTQTQLQNLSEKLVEETGKQLREKAGEISGVFASELSNTGRSFEGQTRQQLEGAVHDAFERIRILFAEAADTTSAAFTDEIQRNARQELEDFTELTNRSLEESRERLDATREEFQHKLTAHQEEFVRRFQTAMSEAVGSGVVDAQEKVEAGFAALRDSWKKMNDANMAEMQSAFGKMSNEGAEQYRARLENISNSWMVATVATLDHKSRDVIAKIATTAEERLQEAMSEVFARFGDTLRERLQQIAVGFEKPAPAK